MQPALKTRLIGAFVLVALIVIVVPLFFSGEPSAENGGQNISLDIPPPPDQKLQTRTMSVSPQATAGTASSAPPPASGDRLATVNIPSRVPPEVMTQADSTPTASAGGQSVSAGTTAASADAAESADNAAPAQPKAVPQPAESKPVKAAAKPEPTSEPGRAAKARYSINLGAYADQNNAKQLMAKVRKLGYPVQLSGTNIGGKPAARVEAGPFDSRAAAEAARLKLGQALPHAPAKLHTVASSQTGDAPAKALSPGRAGGWAVQLVAYSKQADADRLRDRLRKAGFDGYVDSVRSGGHTLWRVRVGPRTQRADAESLRGNIQAKFPHLKGVVVSVP